MRRKRPKFPDTDSPEIDPDDPPFPTGPLWTPLAGPQTEAFNSPADIVFYGGAAGGGKSDLLIGLALLAHRRSIIFRREYGQIQSLEDRSREIIGRAGRYNTVRRGWRMKSGQVLEFGAVQWEGQERKFQGRAHDLVAFDELTHFTEAQFRFLCAWNRTTEPGQRVRVVAAGNPPVSQDGEWIMQFWAPWLDRGHRHKAKPGELRWFAMVDGRDVERPNGNPFKHKGEEIRPRSRTFIPARVEDNPHLMASDYKAILQALPEPIRTRLLKGTFVAEKAIEPGAVIPLEWVVSAQRAWTVMSPGPADSLGVSAAAGVAVTPRHGKWFGPSRLLWAEAPQEGAVVAERLGELAQGGRIQVELDGRGATILDAARRRGLPALPLDGMARSTARERTGRFGFADARSEWWWKLREALDPDSRSAVQIAPDSELASELAAPHWRVGSRGIEIEGPVDIIRRLGRPADKAESLVRAFAGAERD